ncbi:uncharacterized protein [Blastocystis hominis]|uniref:Uncharacterized protein n=1 Tax=Blastocystis hominis TaxID=12968 RepID=D8LY38_BLAHO|nr:uncharacterized protein [Blastocystis hominis]CBK20493.2 unnamed protein product [Blastocystis hominis]|eukprot:XP_012894541.1 uncharacterized protein [Blastocystis hominis]
MQPSLFLSLQNIVTASLCFKGCEFVACDLR